MEKVGQQKLVREFFSHTYMKILGFGKYGEKTYGRQSEDENVKIMPSTPFQMSK